MEIYNLNEIPEPKLTTVGGKAKGLCLMARAGINIAKGFVITDIDNQEDIKQAVSHYQQSGLGAVAVRSSANMEDGAAFSNAGQYKTFLNVSEEDFEKSLIECIASLESEEADSYAKFFNQAKSTQMSVVVQQMVNASKAGVCFTIDPTGNQDTLLVEAVQGLGESLVSGQSAAVQYRINNTQLSNGASLNTQADSLLAEKELREICGEALKASVFFNMPLDTEWAIDDTGAVVWLQARPITSLDEPGIHELDPKWDFANQIITNCNIREMMPGAVTPLTLSTSLYAIDWGLRQMLVSAGMYKNIDDIPAGNITFSIANHLFFNLNEIAKLSEYVFGTNVDSIELSICGRVLEERKELFGEEKVKMKVNPFRAAVNGVKYFNFILSRNKARKQLMKMAETFKFEHHDTAVLQYAELDKQKNIIDLTFLHHYKTSSHSGAMSSALNITLSQDIKDPEEVKSIIAASLENIDGIESVDILRSLRKIARDLITELPDVENIEGEAILHYMKVGQGASHQSYQKFMKRHGHRAILEAEISSLCWEEDEAGFMAYLKTVLSSKGIEPVKENGNYNPYEAIDQRYKGTKRKILHYLVNQARIGVVNRESSKASVIKVFNEIKKGYRRLAELLVTDGILQDVSLIYFLQHHEIGRLVNENETSLVKLALQRKRLYEEQKALTFNDVYVGCPTPEVIQCATLQNGTELKGTPISRGIAQGKARIVKTIEDANALQKGEIMVAVFTDIGWSPYYCKIEALITEVGSVLSHGAVVAREYALPLIANVKGATSLIKTGDLIAVNGTTGVVTVLENATSEQADNTELI